MNIIRKIKGKVRQRRLTRLFTDFIESERSGGLLLIACTAVSLLLANSPVAESYIHSWHFSIGNKSLEFWINDGLMTVFFLLVGLEINRELKVGELADLKRSMLPFLAALGGMLLPALIHFIFNKGTVSQNGYGIPMATDIAFSLAVLSLLGSKVPNSLKVFLTALAIIDDLGAILVIAIFYTEQIHFAYLGAAAFILLALFIMNKLKINFLWIYLLPGIVLWYCLYQSGIHATISGVLLAFVIPFGKGEDNSASSRLQHTLHRPVAFFILPLFALANTAILIPSGWTDTLISANSMGIGIGLILGKPIGIFLFSLLGISMGICSLPDDLKKRHLLGSGILAGIGFTMSIFITLLAFKSQELIDASKIAVMAASLISGLVGYFFLRISLK